MNNTKCRWELKYLSTSSQNHQLHCNFALFVLIHYLHNLKSFNIILSNSTESVTESKQKKTCRGRLVLYKKQEKEKKKKKKRKNEKENK